jgi:hypothetical protein
MCLIVDVNVADRVLFRANDADYKELHRSLVLGKGPRIILAYGGHLTTEYRQSARRIRLILELDRAGRAIQFADSDVNTKQEQVETSGLLESDDPHVIGLALVSNVRILCSDDGELCNDFTGNNFLKKPRGKIYGTPKHAHLIRRLCRH